MVDQQTGKRPVSVPGGKGTALIIGAGATGRGHVGQLAAESGYRLIFVDRDPALCDALRSAGGYEVRLVSAHPRTVRVEGFGVFHTSQKEELYPEFRKAGLIFTAVCPLNIPQAVQDVRDLFVRWLRESGPEEVKNVFCCENMDHSGTTFKNLLVEGFPSSLRPALEARVGFADTMVARVVARPTDPLHLLGEEYSEWTADRLVLRGPDLPQIKTLQLVENQQRYLQRKLFIHNAGHATFGYLGFLKGYRWIHEAAQDSDIMETCVRAIEESGWAIEKEHGFRPEVIAEYRKALTDKCVSPELPDEILRVVREPMRKLGKEERFFGPIGLMLRHGRLPEHLLYGVCGALLARIPGDEQSARLRQRVAQDGAACLSGVVGAPVDPRVVSRVQELLPAVAQRFSA